MPSYSVKSKSKLATCKPELIFLFNTVIKFYDCTILDGYRNKARQSKYILEGKSKTKYPHSKHNLQLSSAVDAAPWTDHGIPWNDKNQFYHFGGCVKGVAEMIQLKIRWGGDWDGDNDLKDQTFFDLAHFELI